MKTIFCIALKGEGATEVDWYHYQENRDEAIGTNGSKSETPFELSVPKFATTDEITDLAEEAAWINSHFPHMQLEHACLI